MIRKPQTTNSSYLYDPIEPLVKPTAVLAMNHNVTPKTIPAEIGLKTLGYYRESFSEDNRKT
jgi:hypothetical protein